MLRQAQELPGIRVFTAQRFADDRGELLQSYVRSALAAMGIHADFRQAIQSTSRCGVVRGLHFQWEPAQGKLVRCVAGRVFDVVVDVRHGSPTLGDHAVVELSEDNRQVIWISPGFAHGFLAQQERSIVLYECTAEWAPEGEGGILWDDPALGIQWPAQSSVTVSEKDRRQPTLDLWLRDPRSRKFMFPGQPA